MSSFEGLPGYEVRDGMEFFFGIGGSAPGGKLTDEDVWRGQELHELLDGGRQRVSASSGSGIVSVADVRAALAGPALPPSSAPMWRSGSNLPAITASGFPPSALMSLPWPARFAAARASTLSAAYEIFTTYGDPHDENEVAQALLDFSGDSDLVDFQNRSQSARIASMSDDEHYDSLFAALDEPRNDVESQSPPTKTVFKATRPDGRPIT